MKRQIVKSEINYNLLYDPAGIKAAISYLAKNNKNVSVTYENIYNEILKNSAKNAKFAYEDRSHDGKWNMSFSGTAGYIILFSLEEYTAKNHFPIISAEVYVTPNIGNSKIVEEKIRT